MTTKSRKCHGMRTITGGIALGLCATILFVVGCEDPYSKRRIQRRWDHLNSTAADIGKREADSPRRIEEEMNTLREWWKSDCERFNRKAPTVGDYVW